MIHKSHTSVAAYGRSRISGKETGKETTAEIKGRARIAVVASNNTVVLRLKVEFEDIALLSFDLLRVELVVAGGCNLNSLGGGQVSHSGRGEQSLERRHFD
jgi:hypothetical protein